MRASRRRFAAHELRHHAAVEIAHEGVNRRFNGPPNSANGGYARGLAGTAVKAPAVRVSLRKPPPLDVPLLRHREDDGSVSLLSGDDVIATAMPAAVRAQAPPAPTVEEAEIATRSYVGFTHPGSRPASSAGRHATMACGSTPVMSGTAP